MAMGNLKLNGGMTAEYKGTDDFQRPVWKVVDGDLEFKMVCTNFDGSNLCTVAPSGEPCTPVLKRYRVFNLSDALELFAAELYDINVEKALGNETWVYDADLYPVSLEHLFDEYWNGSNNSALLIYRAGAMMTAWAEQE